MKKSWKTSAAGWGTIMATVGTAINQLSDGNPATNPDWNYVIPLSLHGTDRNFRSGQQGF